METFLGLLGLLGFVIAIVALAAGVTYSVVRLTPQRDDKPETQSN
jgi:cell division protein FtsX